MSLGRWSPLLRLPIAPTALALALLVGVPPSGSTPVPAGGAVVRFDGVAVRVPAGWPVYDLSRDPQRCVRLDVHAVYVGEPGADERCPAHLVGRTEAVMVGPAHRAPASPPDLAGAYTRVLGGGRVEVTASFADRPSLAREIVDSAAVVAHPAPTSAAPAIAPAAAVVPAATTTQTGVWMGNGFDACNAPSLSAMKAWMATSPYRAANIYIGGSNRACANKNLTSTWVSSARSMTWRLIPTYVGRQAPCTQLSNVWKVSSDPTKAASQGKSAADDAATIAANLGLPAGSPVYFDMEYYPRGGSCSTAVLSFLSAWTKELHARNLRSGVYGSGSSVVTDLKNQVGTSYPEPDDLWFANWNGLDSTYGDQYVPDSMWIRHQRIHQWHGGQNQTYGGYTINIDGDALDGEVVGPRTVCANYPAEVHGPDDCDGSVSLSGPLQYWRLGSTFGLAHSMRWTKGNGSTESDGATWAPHLDAGVYDLSVWVPTAGGWIPNPSASTAHYTVTDAAGAHSVLADQGSNLGTWVDLGQYTTGLSGTITAHLGDDTSTSSVIALDAMKFHFLHSIDVNPPTGQITTPAAGSWSHPGAAVTVGGTFTDDAYVTKVAFFVADSSGSWQPIGTDVHNGNGTFSVTWSESYPEGSVLSFRADIYDTNPDHETTVTASNVLTIDATPPTAALTRPTGWFGTGSSQRLTWVGSDNASGVAWYDVRYQVSHLGGWTSGWRSVVRGFTGTSTTFTGMRQGYQYCFQVRDRDRAGNYSPWSAARCVSRVLDDRALSPATSWWWRPSGERGYFASTFSSTSHYNAQLTHWPVTATRIALYVSTCSTCGKVSVSIGGTRVATFNLYSPTWHRHVFIGTRVFARMHGQLVLRTTRGGKLVRIDGIVVAR